jgi:prophage regulatory protein
MGFVELKPILPTGLMGNVGDVRGVHSMTTGQPSWHGQLMGLQEICNRFGVSKNVADRLTRTEGFPMPIGRPHIGRVWLADDVEAWIWEHPEWARRANQV